MCEENLAAHKARLSELKNLVSKIAEDVGLDSEVLLQGEVDALGKKLEDVRESLTTLVGAAEKKLAVHEECAEDLHSAKSFLTSVQQVRSYQHLEEIYFNQICYVSMCWPHLKTLLSIFLIVQI